MKKTGRHFILKDFLMDDCECLKCISWPDRLPKRLATHIWRFETYRKVFEKNKKTILDIFSCLELEKIESAAKMAHICGEISERDLDMILIKIGFTHLADSYPDIREKIMRELGSDEEKTSPTP